MLLLVAIFIVLLAGATLPASRLLAQGPENTLVVINADSQQSMAVANRFIDLRSIPAANVVYLSGITHDEKQGDDSSRSEDFIEQIARPVMAAIRDRHLDDQISCITYSAGFPTRFNAKAQVEKFCESRGLTPNKVWHGSWASITSLTYLYNDAFSPKPQHFLDSNANRYAGMASRNWLKNPFEGESAERFDRAKALIKNKDFVGANKILDKLYWLHPRQMSVVISIARAAALQGKHKKALNALTYAASQGFDWGDALLQEKAFESIRNNAQFKSLVASMDRSSDRLTPTRNFSPNDYWAVNGWPNGTADQGQRYYLSTMLAVVGDNGRSPLKSALVQMDRSCTADGTHPKGNVYFAKNGDVRSKVRTPQFEKAVAELQSLGHGAYIGGSTIPKNQTLVGATLGRSAVNVKESGSQFCPGSLCDNLTSYGGHWPTNQTNLNVYLDAGAAGASGTVDEPFAIANKFPTARLHVHYARGCTLAESFYQTVQWPFQLLIVGDPLCAPFGNFPRFRITGLKDGSVVTKDFALTVYRESNSPKIKHVEVFYDDVFRAISDSGEISISIDSLADGYHEVRIVGVSDSPVANRKSEKISFVIQRAEPDVSITVENPNCSIDDTLKVTATSSVEGQEIQIMQNSRVITTVTNGKTFLIPASRLGLGKTKLQSVAKLSDGQVIKSSPISVLLKPSS